MSVKKVSNKGPLPKCKSCNEFLKRDENRVLKVKYTKLSPGKWQKNISSIHLSEYCIRKELNLQDIDSLNELVDEDKRIKIDDRKKSFVPKVSKRKLKHISLNKLADEDKQIKINNRKKTFVPKRSKRKSNRIY